MNDKMIKLRISADELKDWKFKAEMSGQTLSAWIRDTCNEPMITRIRGEQATKILEKKLPIAPNSPAPTLQEYNDFRGTAALAGAECCSHRKRVGEVCYKCDPKFGYPVIE